MDPNLPAGYGAYGVQTVGNRIIVTYARQPPADPPAGVKYREVPGAGIGVVNAFDLEGTLHLARRLAGRRAQRSVGHRAGGHATSAPSAATC